MADSYEVETMNIVWVLFVMPALALFYAACVTVRDSSVGLKARIATPQLSDLHRRIERISMKDADHLMQDSQDMILIDLRPDWGRTPIPFPVANILFVPPNQLDGILSWLPSASSVALYCTSECYFGVMRTVLHLSGSAPVYLLSESFIPSAMARG